MTSICFIVKMMNNAMHVATKQQHDVTRCIVRVPLGWEHDERERERERSYECAGRGEGGERNTYLRVPQ